MTRSVTGTSTVQSLSYSFDAAGDLTAITDSLDTTRNQTLHYDALYRLTQAGGVYGAYSYGYDAVGNRTALGLTTSGGSSASTYNYSATSNQLQTVVTGTTTRTLTYGATGNITGDDFGNGTVYNFTYNQDNRLAQAGAGFSSPYTYDFRGRRVFKEQPNFLYFHYDRGGHLISESIHGGLEWHEYVWLDDLPLAFIAFGSIDYIHADHLGTPQKMTDGSQAIVWDGAASDPFMLGQLPGSPPMNLRFPGQYFDQETGLHHNGMRDYDPTLGRYIESDPIGLGGGINTYAYVGSNPLKWTDRLGLQCEETPHNYHIAIVTRCPAADAFKMLLAPDMSAPGAPAAQEGITSPIMLWGGNPISQSVNSSTMTIINKTLPGHQFYPGSVVIQVTPGPGGDGSVVSITGTGTGSNPAGNDAIGLGYFGGVASLIAYFCSDLNGVPGM